MAATDIMREPARHIDPLAPDRRRQQSWAWLVVGAVLLPFTTFQTVIPAAAWLAPIFLLRFVRTQRARVAFPVMALVGYGATLIALRGTWAGSRLLLFSLPGLLAVLSYGADKVAAGRLHSVVRTLVFPAVETAVPFVLSGLIVDQARLRALLDMLWDAGVQVIAVSTTKTFGDRSAGSSHPG